MADLTDKEIIKGLMLKLADENVNVTKLVQRIGMKNYKKWDKAYQAAFKYVKE